MLTRGRKSIYSDNTHLCRLMAASYLQAARRWVSQFRKGKTIALFEVGYALGALRKWTDGLNEENVYFSRSSADQINWLAEKLKRRVRELTREYEVWFSIDKGWTEDGK